MFQVIPGGVIMLNVETAPDRAVRARSRTSESIMRILRYTLVRGVTLFITIIIGVYLAILIANMGGYVDEMRKSSLKEQIEQSLQNDEEYKLLSPAQKLQRVNEIYALREAELGLDQPFLVRSLKYLWNGLTLNFGQAEYLLSDSGSRQVRNILGERLGPTLLLMATG